MALHPEYQFDDVKAKVITGVENTFPIIGSKHILEAKNVKINDVKDREDFPAQLQSKFQGRTWAVPVTADLRIKDRSTGRIIDSKPGARIAELPRITDRYSYIVKGNEYQVDHIWRRKPGVYSRIKENGDLQAEFNLAKGRNFEIIFDPEKRKFNIGYENSTIPLYPVLKSLGISDDKLKAQWGKDILAANKAVNEAAALRKFNKVLGGQLTDPVDDARMRISDTLGATILSPETTEMTLGKSFNKVTPEVLVRSSDKLLGISRGKVKPDDRDAIKFKTLHGLGDLLQERIEKGGRRITYKIRNNLDRRNAVDDVYSPRMFTGLINSQFSEDSLSQLPDQNNPVDDVNGMVRTTILGAGGISSEQQIIDTAKSVDPSHIGFMDTIYTPEGARAGITAHMALGATVDRTIPKTRLYNMKTGKREYVDAPTVAKSVVIMPDEVEWVGKKPKPKARKVRALIDGSEFELVSPSKADYAFPLNSAIFGMGTNLVPFLQNNSANRISMASRTMAQSVGLKEREPALVQSEATPGRSWDEVMGRGFAMKARTGGKVTSVSPEAIRIKTPEGKLVKQYLYDNFPLNLDGNYYSHIPLVKKGDIVKESDIIADHNFTKDGVLALGKNLYAGYLSIPGKTFEDGIVISESAAKKLTSDHMYRYSAGKSDEIVQNRRKFRAYYPTAYTADQLTTVDDDGVIKEGTEVMPGDPLLLNLTKKPISLEGKAMARLHKSLVKPYSDTSQKWDKETPGKVVRVVKGNKETQVHVRMSAPATEGDKLVGRHGNKGIISIVLPDTEMPHDGQGRALDVALNPYGVPGRQNIGQIYEMATAKVAEKTGKPYKVPNFGVDDSHAWVKKELKKHGLSEQEELYDPKTGRKLGNVMAGPLYMTKMKHMVEHKFKARAGGPGYPYDINRSPKRGGPEGGQAFGELDHYALLAHGAKNILREAHTYKSDMDSQDELWRAMQLGSPLPPPQVPFAYKKFEGYLKSLGVDPVKKGNTLQLQPVTDKAIRDMAAGRVTQPTTFRAKDLKPEVGGLFDPKATKGIEGDAWSYYQLPEEMPNPLYEKSIQALTGLTKQELRDVIAGDKGITFVKQSAVGAGQWQVVGAEDSDITGGPAVRAMLDSVNVNQEINALDTQLPKLGGQQLDKAHRKLRYLKALKGYGAKPTDAYMMKNMPIMPPVMRPVMVLPSGDLSIDNLNELYRGIIISGNTLKDSKKKLPDEQLKPIRREMYDGLVALSGIGAKKRVQGDELAGVLRVLHGDTPKTGYFQNKLITRRQDLSARSTIVPNPSLGLDEMGIPKKMAMTTYKPFVVRELNSLGYTPLQAQELIKENASIADTALEKAIEKRPLLAKRDPVLHKYGIMAFKPKIVGGKAIQIHPLVTGPYNADFDGDTMAIYTPVSNESVKEAWSMMPSKHLFAPATGRVVFTPSNETVLGLYKLTEQGKGKAKRFDSFDTAIQAAMDKKIRVDAPIVVGKTKTTPGRAMIYSKLPAPVRDEKILTDKDMIFNGPGIDNFLAGVAKNQPAYYSDAASALMNLGNEEVYERAHSYSLDDFKPDAATRNKFIKPIADQWGKLPPDQMISKLQAAEKKMSAAHIKKFWDDPNNLQVMVKAGVKPQWNQYKQMVMTPVMMEDTQGRPIPNPIAQSWSEGVDTTGMVLQSMGARHSIVRKTQEVSAPGVLTKRVNNTVINNVVSEDDCGTKKGELLAIEHPDVIDRYLVKGAGGYGAGTLVTPSVLQGLKKKKLRGIEVRSPSQCEIATGICATCYGIGGHGHKPEKGTNLGVMAGQAIGERSTQLMLKAVHFTGAMGAGGAAMNEFDRVEQLLKMPQKIPNAATLATETGKIKKITKDPAGGYNVDIAGDRHYVPQRLGVTPGLKVGSKVQKGQPISGGHINPHDLLPLVGIHGVRRQIADELDQVYGGEGIRRRNVELLARAVTNLGKVMDPGGDVKLIRGDYIPISVADAYNRDPKNKKPIKYEAILKGVNELPHDQTEDWLARLNHTRIKDTIIDAANQGWVSNLHGMHPVPALAYGPEFGTIQYGY